MKSNRKEGYLGAIIFLILLMWIVIFMLPLSISMLISDIRTVIESGFGIFNFGESVLFLLCGIIAMSLLIPSFRKLYYLFPWLELYVRILLLDLVILTVALKILNMGYEVMNPNRHRIFIGVMVFQIVISRVALSFYFMKKE